MLEIVHLYQALQLSIKHFWKITLKLFKELIKSKVLRLIPQCNKPERIEMILCICKWKGVAEANSNEQKEIWSKAIKTF